MSAVPRREWMLVRLPYFTSVNRPDGWYQNENAVTNHTGTQTTTKKSISAVCGFPLEMMNETRDDGFGTTSSISNCNDPTYDVLLSVPIYLSNILSSIY